MSYNVLLQKHPAEGYRATLMAWPGIEVKAGTQEDALDKLRAAVTDMLEDGEVIQLDFPEIQSIIPATYQETFGMFRDDPTFGEFLTEVEKFRQRDIGNGQP